MKKTGLDHFDQTLTSTEIQEKSKYRVKRVNSLVVRTNYMMIAIIAENIHSADTGNAFFCYAKYMYLHIRMNRMNHQRKHCIA